MTTATAILRGEHDAILRMLEAAEEVARQLEVGEQVSPEVLRGLVHFFRVFADRCHHSKEEELLFPFLEMKGVPRSGGPIAVMLYEHELGRSLIKRMLEAADAYSGSASEAGKRWVDAARGYAALLRHHIDKENNVLFRAAERMLSDAEQSALAEAFAKVEEEKIGAGTHERLHVLMEKLLADIWHHGSQDRKQEADSGLDPTAEMRAQSRIVG